MATNQEVVCKEACDAQVEGKTVAMHEGQVYELPDDEVERLGDKVRARAGREVKTEETAPETKDGEDAAEAEAEETPPESKTGRGGRAGRR